MPTSVSTAAKAAHQSASVKIDQPPTADIPPLTGLSGQETNLQPGQLVWTFWQFVNQDGSFSQNTFPNPGPCTVDYVQQTWTCNGIGIGGGPGIYRVCAAILSASDAFKVVKLLINTPRTNEMSANETSKSNPDWFFVVKPSFIDDNSDACMSVHRTS